MLFRQNTFPDKGVVSAQILLYQWQFLMSGGVTPFWCESGYVRASLNAKFNQLRKQHNTATTTTYGKFKIQAY